MLLKYWMDEGTFRKDETRTNTYCILSDLAVDVFMYENH